MATKETVRFDLRASRKQRDIFERAAEIGGYKSLTDFVLAAAFEKAEAILQKHNAWLSSEKDRQSFFKALVNPSAANARLRRAMKRHNEFNPKKY
ncbi:MAG: DUF1778 domain-containing protein [Cyclobacteriaceae bacterium]